MKGMINKDMQDRDPSPSLGMTANKGVTRVAMAVRSANRHRYPILQKPLVIPNEAQRNEESHEFEQILKKQN
jgi:hypothetical protein